MSTRAYPTSRKLIDLLGDIAIISLTYIVLALILVNRQSLVTHIVLYSGMLPLAVVLSIGLFIIYGLYTLQYKRFSEIIISLFVSLIAVFFIIMAISFLFNYSYYSRILLISSTVVQFILLICPFCFNNFVRYCNKLQWVEDSFKFCNYKICKQN